MKKKKKCFPRLPTYSIGVRELLAYEWGAELGFSVTLSRYPSAASTVASLARLDWKLYSLM